MLPGFVIKAVESAREHSHVRSLRRLFARVRTASVLLVQMQSWFRLAARRPLDKAYQSG